MKRAKTNALRRMILIALEGATHPCNTTQIRYACGHPNEYSVYSALRPMARQGLVRVAGREPINGKSKLTRPLYVISDKGRAWLVRNRDKLPVPGRAPGTVARKHDDGAVANLLSTKWR